MKKIPYLFLILILWISACKKGKNQEGKTSEPATPAQLDDPNRVVKSLSCLREQIDVYSESPLFLVDSGATVIWMAGMAIDADGSPRAYHPVSDKGLDNLSSAGYSGNWWALATENGQPVIQKAGDPAPGYYVSMTSLFDPAFPESNPRRYVDAETIPYIVINRNLLSKSNIKTGDLAAVCNFKNDKFAYAIVADVGDNNRVGEGSIALARLLDINADPRVGGQEDKVGYVVFPGSGNKKPKTVETINKEAAALFEKWGGVDRLFYCSENEE